MNLIELAQQFNTEEKAREFLEKSLWPDGAICPHCGVIGESYRLVARPGSKKPVRPGVWKCRACSKQFTVKVGTIFEDSHIPLHKWLLAMHLMVASKKGMSSHQMHRQLGITYKSAWFMTHRIRWAMRQESFAGPLTGEVEADETYVGGKKIGQGVYAGKKAKAPVVSLVERGGGVRSFHVPEVTAENLRPIIDEHVNPGSRLNTDDSAVYPAALPEGMQHDVVNHSIREYSRVEDGRLITTNTVEGFFSLLKRGVYGTFHNISKHHLHRYLNEFDFRYNARKITDGERTALAIQGAEGKRLMYH
jgi:transposase-like protein